MSFPVPATLVALSSSSSGSVSTVSAIHVEMSEGLGTGSTVHSGSLGEVIRGLVAHGVEFSSHCTTRQNPSKLVERISYLQEYCHLADLKLLVCVVLPL